MTSGPVDNNTSQPVITPLRDLNWDSDTCECKVEVRRYHIEKVPSRITRNDNGEHSIEPERMVCVLEYLDGSYEDVPLRRVPISSLYGSNQNATYWRQVEKQRASHVRQIDEAIDCIKADATLPEGFPEETTTEELTQYRARVLNAHVYVDEDNVARSPGTQTRGHISKPCDLHRHIDTRSLQSQIATQRCGCRIRQVTKGEGRELGIQHEHVVSLCWMHSGVKKLKDVLFG